MAHHRRVARTPASWRSREETSARESIKESAARREFRSHVQPHRRRRVRVPPMTHTPRELARSAAFALPCGRSFGTPKLPGFQRPHGRRPARRATRIHTADMWRIPHQQHHSGRVATGRPCSDTPVPDTPPPGPPGCDRRADRLQDTATSEGRRSCTPSISPTRRGPHEELVTYIADQQDFDADAGVHVALRDGSIWDPERLRRGAAHRPGLDAAVPAGRRHPMGRAQCEHPAAPVLVPRPALAGTRWPTWPGSVWRRISHHTGPGCFTRIMLRQAGLDPGPRCRDHRPCTRRLRHGPAQAARRHDRRRGGGRHPGARSRGRRERLAGAGLRR